MPARRAKLRTIGLGMVALVVLGALSVGVLTWLLRQTGPSQRVVSEEGGVSVAVPKNWSVDELHPTDADHQEFLNGREKAVLGMLQRGGFWVARWPAAADATTETIKARMRRDHKETPRDDWAISDGTVAGHRAVLQRYAKPPDALQWMRLGKVRIVVRELIANGFVYQVGTWTLPHAGNVTRTLEDITHSLRVFQPRPWNADLDDIGATLRLPGGWVEHKTDLPGAILFALSPNDPNDAWAYVFHYDDSPAASLRAARTNIAKNGGTVEEPRDARLAGRKAVRLEFTFRDGDRAYAHGTEWFVDDGDGGTVVLAVGRRAGDEKIAERIAAGWRF